MQGFHHSCFAFANALTPLFWISIIWKETESWLYSVTLVLQTAFLFYSYEISLSIPPSAGYYF